jgi:hypothetical protein
MYHLDFSNQKKFRLSWREAIITMIEQEYVYQNAVKEGLHKSPVVEAEVAMWRESIAANALIRKFFSTEPQPTNEQQAENFSEAQLQMLTDKLLALSNASQVEVDLATWRAVEVSNAGLLVLKKHFPGRLVVPMSLPLENLTIWQDKVAEKIWPRATN